MDFTRQYDSLSSVQVANKVVEILGLSFADVRKYSRQQPRNYGDPEIPLRILVRSAYALCHVLPSRELHLPI